jgi:ATP-dependent DNA ligase
MATRATSQSAQQRSQQRRPQENREEQMNARVSMPSVVEPMQPTLSKQPFSNPEWLFEAKWDSYRAATIA